MDILPYLKLLIEKQGSDLFFSSGAQIKMKIEGNTVSVGKTILDQDMTRSAAFGIMNERQIQLFETNWEADFAIELPDRSNRFRVNVFRQRGEVAMVLRRIPNHIPAVEELGLPSVLKQLITHKRGLILMVGATGSGKSTTLAAIIAYRNEKISGHILTV